MNQRVIIQNPNGVAFQESYTVLGKVEGKNQLRADCQRLQIRVSSSALQAIEKGYSHKMRASYANSENTQDGRATVWGESRLQTSGNSIKKKVVVVVKSKEEVDAEAEVKRLEDKKKRGEIRKTKKWDAMKKKIAKAESWEDIVI